MVGDKVAIIDDPALALLSTVAFREEVEEEEITVEETEGGAEGEGGEEAKDGE